MTLPTTFPVLSACLLSTALFGANGASAQTINALGTGIASAYVNGCTPMLGKDFVDTGNWDNRMVEPRDCTLVHLATPIFSWPLPVDMKLGDDMTLTVVRPDGSTIGRVTTSPHLILTETRLLPGQYKWSVSYTNKSGVRITSQMRRFTVENTPDLLSLPDGLSLANNISGKSHPRALPKGSTFADIVMKAKNGEYQKAYAAFITRADSLKGGSSVPAYIDSSLAASYSDKTDSNALHEASNAAFVARTNIELLGYAGFFTGNASYHDTAIANLMALATWDPLGMTGELSQDQANRDVYLGLAVGLDLLQYRLTPLQRSTVVTALKQRLVQVMAKLDHLDVLPNNSHLLTTTAYATETLMYVVGMSDFPEAKAMLNKSWTAYISLMGAWSGSTDGAFANSTAYGWFALANSARALAAIKLVADLDLTPMPAAGALGDNQIAFAAPNATLRSPFGDALENERRYFDYSYDGYRLYASVTGRSRHEWYWRARPSNVTLAVPLQAMHYLLLGKRIPVAPSAAPALPNSWLFEDAGTVAMHSQSADPARSSVFFRSSRFGSINHSHADNNSFSFVSHGKAMLISGGYYPYFNSPHHALVGRATRFKNALTFDGGIGQAEPTSVLTARSVPGRPRYSMEARGQLINFADTGAWAVTTGDATLAYAGKGESDTTFTPFVTNAIRSVGYNRNKKIVVIYDWATSDSARTWELNFQSLQAPTLSSRIVRVNNEGVSACIEVHGLSGPITFSSGFPLLPEVSRPNEFQTRYHTVMPLKQLVSMTLIREDCNTAGVSVTLNGTAARVVISGEMPLTFDRKTIRSQ